MKSRSHSFIVRIWEEPLDDEKSLAIWRGSVDYVGSNERFYFYSLDSIAGYIVEKLGFNIKMKEKILSKFFYQPIHKAENQPAQLSDLGMLEIDEDHIE